MKLVSHKIIEEIFSASDKEISRYKLVLQIPGELSKLIRRSAIADAKKRARFPGFRPGQIPPFMKKEIHGFCFLEGVKEVLDEAVQELDVKRMDGEANEPQFGRDIDELIKEFEVGKEYEFECKIPLEKALGGKGEQKGDESDQSESIDVTPVQNQVEEKSAANT